MAKGQIKDLTGQKFGKLTAIQIRKDVPRSNGSFFWDFSCSCGSISTKLGTAVKRGQIKSCGCTRGDKESRGINIIGNKYGKLTVICVAPRKKKQVNDCYECLCDCGETIFLTKRKILKGKISTCGCKNGKNLIGETIGELKVISRQKTRGGKYLCECSCGVQKEISTNLLVSKKNISCGCKRFSGKTPQGDRKELVLRHIFLHKYMKRHKKISPNTKSDLSFGDFMILTKQNCDYCDSPPSNEATDILTKNKIPYQGIDRIDSKIGYVKSNCVPCCCFCNSFKSNLSRSEFLLKIKQIMNHHELW